MDMKKDYQGYLIDLDGTMYSGTDKIAEAAPFIDRLRHAHKKILFLTNNSTATPKKVVDKLWQISGVKAYEEEIYTSSEATVEYAEKLGGDTVFMIGEGGLAEALATSSFALSDQHPDHVIVGLDRSVTYEELTIATLAIRQGAHFIATNPDSNLPTERGMIPGNGALVAFLEAATQKQATVVGKPEHIMMEGALDKLKLDRGQVIMVGDNYTTDIMAGIQNGIDTLLVLTGFTSREDIPNLPTPPTHIVNDLGEW